MALDAVHRFSSFGAVPSVLKRIISTPDCISALVRIVGGTYEPLHTREHPSRPKGVGRVQLRDRIHAARVLLKVAEGFGGISSLQRHEKELVRECKGGYEGGGSSRCLVVCVLVLISFDFPLSWCM